MSETQTKVDHSALRTNQAMIIILLLTGFILNFPWLVALTALVMIVGTVIKRPGFAFIYTSWLKPRNWIKPDVIQDNPEPHRFAQGFGAVVLTASIIGLFVGAGVLGWALTWLVIALASLNLFIGFCAGCAMYYWLNRLKVPGFVKSAPAGTFPGMRPKASSS
jgi:hypothetical protein